MNSLDLTDDQLARSFKPAELQIVKSALAGLSPEEIAVDLDYELTSVKLVLTKLATVKTGLSGIPNFSVELNQVQENPDPKNLIKPTFTDDEVDIARNSVMELVRGAEVEGVKLKAAVFVIDDHKGRLDVAKNMAEAQFSLSAVNAAMAKARLAMEATRLKAKLIKEAKAA